ncbi:MAG: MBL fold metallo-hydrolase, partial [Syntrophomonas sp.]|nr:MBL fold metallo-hydrolase [Syntrophomonas sp.]
RKAVIATDLGIVSREVEQALSFSDIAVLESNHDPQMLKNGPYPPYLKKRIEGREGHLSNFDTARLLSSVPRHNPMQVLLAHISQQNNHPMLAQQTVSRIMQESGCEVGREIGIYPTFPHHGITCTMTGVFAVNAPLFQGNDLLVKQDGRGKAN